MLKPEQNSYRGVEIAIVGLAFRGPGARDAVEYWRNIVGEVEGIRDLAREELLAAGVDERLLASPRYVKRRGVLDGADEFDARFFGINAREAQGMDQQHRLMLETVWGALEDAGYDVESYSGAIGLFAGATPSGYLHQLRANSALYALVGGYQATIGTATDFLAARVSYKLNLRGPSLSVQASCSTSLVAIHLACRSLLAGECDIALAGGVSATSPQHTGYVFEAGGITAPDGRCRAYDADAQGTVGGSGVGVVVLKRLADALADGDAIRAVIRGSAVNNDGSDKVGFTAPSVTGQARDH